MADQTGSNGTGTQASVTANIWDARGVQHSITIGGLPAGQWVSGQYQVSRFQTAVVQLTGFTDTPQQVLRVVDLATGEDGVVPAADLDLDYRRSNLSDSQVVVHADLQLAPGDSETGEATLSEIVRWRREHQPGGQNAGSVFTNPPGESAGRLIDAAGCRGLRSGSALVSTKHANFIQADAGGSADDVFDLMVAVARRVLDAHGVMLHPETRMVGFPSFDDAVGAAT